MTTKQDEENAAMMPRVSRLPPLKEESDMPRDLPRNVSKEKEAAYKRRPRRYSLATSDPNLDELPIDCVLVYSRNDDENESNGKSHMTPSERRKNFEYYIEKKQGLILKRVEPKGGRVGYVLVHTPFKMLLVTAENIRMRLPIEKIEQDEKMHSQANDSCWERFKTALKRPFRVDPSLTKDDPDYYTAIYSSNIPNFQSLFDELRGSRELYFTPAERSLLTYELLTKAHYDDQDDNELRYEPVSTRAVSNMVGRKIKRSSRPGIDRLIAKKAYDACFPLHEPLRDEEFRSPADLNDREKLQKHWATMRKCLKFQPLSLIRSYMGEKVTFYFALTGFYNQMLMPPSIVGLIIFIYGAATVLSDEPTSDICGSYGSNTYMCPRCDKVCPFWKLSDSCVYSKISYVFDNAATVIFAVFMSLWARWFVEFWQRRQAVLRYEWDSMDFEEHLEPIRPDFERKSAIIGENIEEPYISTRKRVPFFLLSIAVVLITILIVCGTIFGTIVYRVQMDYILKNTSVKTYSSIIITVTSAIINLICSLILSQLYYWLAGKITDLELHKYQSKYDDSLTIKIYLFQFVNFYSSLFYIAFFKGRFLEYPSKYGEQGPSDFTEQCDPAGCLVELSIQFVTSKQIVNNIVEFCFAMHRTCLRICSRRKEDQKQWEEDHDLIDFNSTVLIDEYLELVIQFGFVTLFVVAFPLAPLLALINNLIELRLDAWKLLSKYKRPIPYKASDIGIWSDIISAISYLAVLTNAIVIAWTSEFIPKMAYRVLTSGGANLNDYVDWTLSSFSIQDYNNTGRMTADVPTGLTTCRYRDFRESVGPSYSQTTLYWNILAARLAFIIIFEHCIFFIIYIMQWLVANVPKNVQNKIDRERFIDQRERWTSGPNGENFKDVAIVSHAVARMANISNNNSPSIHKTNEKHITRKRNGKKHIGIRITPEDKK
ncbi:hypothetical protein I4U23_014825 [Adineta vaga]|nr:hypothetical protein I4U23_014825 [Adineta vaga]